MIIFLYSCEWDVSSFFSTNAYLLSTGLKAVAERSPEGLSAEELVAPD